MCTAATKELDDAAVVAALAGLPDESIYGESRVAQPDEVWNYGRGDALERALCLAAILKQRHPGLAMTLESAGGRVVFAAGDVRVDWPLARALPASLHF